MRVAVSGRSVGPPLFESLALLGRERTLHRLRVARSRVTSPAPPGRTASRPRARSHRPPPTRSRPRRTHRSSASTPSPAAAPRRPWWRRPRLLRSGRPRPPAGAAGLRGRSRVQVWQASRGGCGRPFAGDRGARRRAVQRHALRRSSGQRLDHALELYRDGEAPRIIITGGRQAGDRSPSDHGLRLPASRRRPEQRSSRRCRAAAPTSRSPPGPLPSAAALTDVLFVTSPRPREAGRRDRRRGRFSGGVSPTGHQAPTASLGRDARGRRRPRRALRSPRRARSPLIVRSASRR